MNRLHALRLELARVNSPRETLSWCRGLDCASVVSFPESREGNEIDGDISFIFRAAGPDMDSQLHGGRVSGQVAAAVPKSMGGRRLASRGRVSVRRRRRRELPVGGFGLGGGAPPRRARQCAVQVAASVSHAGGLGRRVCPGGCRDARAGERGGDRTHREPEVPRTHSGGDVWPMVIRPGGDDSASQRPSWRALSGSRPRSSFHSNDSRRGTARRWWHGPRCRAQDPALPPAGRPSRWRSSARR